MTGPSSAKPLFLLGMGAQKAGTTWLYHHLQSNELMAFGPDKEIHAWDFLSLGDRHRLRYLGAAIETYRHGELQALRRLQAEVLLMQMASDPALYRRYFLSLARRRGLPVGDLTPNYQSLSKDKLRQVLHLLSETFQVKVIFLMRDPLERCFSWVKHRTQRLTTHDHYGKDPLKELDRELREMRAALRERSLPPSRNKSNYIHTIEMLDACLPEEDLLYLFYEELFSVESIERISEFLGVPYRDPQLNLRVNHDPHQTPFPAACEAIALEVFAPVYRFVETRFGRLPRGWRQVERHGNPSR